MFCSIHYAESKYVFFLFKTEGKSLKKSNLFKKNFFGKFSTKIGKIFWKFWWEEILAREIFARENFNEERF